MDHDGTAAAAKAEAAVRTRTLRLWAAAVQQVTVSLTAANPFLILTPNDVRLLLLLTQTNSHAPCCLLPGARAMRQRR